MVQAQAQDEAAAGRRRGRGTGAEELERRKTTCRLRECDSREAACFTLDGEAVSKGSLAVRQRDAVGLDAFGVVDPRTVREDGGTPTRWKMRS